MTTTKRVRDLFDHDRNVGALCVGGKVHDLDLRIPLLLCITEVNGLSLCPNVSVRGKILESIDMIGHQQNKKWSPEDNRVTAQTTTEIFFQTRFLLIFLLC